MTTDPTSPKSTSTGASKTQKQSRSQEQTGQKPRGWTQVWENLVHMGLGEISLRAGTALASLILIVLVVWIMGSFYLGGEISTFSTSVQAAAVATPTPEVKVPARNKNPEVYGISRLAEIHTILPSRPRFDVVEYTVEKGDTIFGIAEKFNLSPSTILWGNYLTLQDNPHFLKPDMTLNILPANGTYYQWTAADGLNGVSEYFKVTPEDIINWPGNQMDAGTIGDYAHPNIEAGKWLFVPGGSREFITWSAPRITRSDPAVARVLGPGYCGTIADGAVGIGTFIWPTSQKWLSGFKYSPETNHFGVDIGGQEGNAIYAVDNGVVVYSGWNDHGYGYMIVIDHGGWQSLYAHLSAINATCGQSVFQGDAIGAMGSTGNSSGPHLHFELLSDDYGKVDPIQFLP
jgi:hypothetical protein